MISAVILAHNSQSTIRRAIESVLWCTEVLVIDDFSTDKTESIAKSLGVRVIHHALKGDYSAQRNFGLGISTNPWILYIDSDEYIGEELREEIRKRTRNEHYVGYRFHRSDLFLGKKLVYGETSAIKLLRLSKKNTGIWVRPVHEIWDIHGPVGDMKGQILHFPHDTITQFIDAVNTYSTLNAQYLYSNNTQILWWHIAIYPLAKFVKNYFVYQGFRDGTQGAIHALVMSFHSFLTRAKLWQLWDKKIL